MGTKERVAAQGQSGRPIPSSAQSRAQTKAQAESTWPSQTPTPRRPPVGCKVHGALADLIMPWHSREGDLGQLPSVSPPVQFEVGEQRICAAMAPGDPPLLPCHHLFPTELPDGGADSTRSLQWVLNHKLRLGVGHSSCLLPSPSLQGPVPALLTIFHQVPITARSQPGQRPYPSLSRLPHSLPRPFPRP